MKKKIDKEKKVDSKWMAAQLRVLAQMVEEGTAEITELNITVSAQGIPFDLDEFEFKGRAFRPWEFAIKNKNTPIFILDDPSDDEATALALAVEFDEKKWIKAQEEADEMIQKLLGGMINNEDS